MGKTKMRNTPGRKPALREWILRNEAIGTPRIDLAPQKRDECRGGFCETKPLVEGDPRLEISKFRLIEGRGAGLPGGLDIGMSSCEATPFRLPSVVGFAGIGAA